MFHTENFYEVDFSMSVIQSKVERDTSTNTGSPCNSRILGQMEIRELQNREFQGLPYLGLDVP